MASDDEHVFENGDEDLEQHSQINGKQQRNPFLNNFALITSVKSHIRLKSGSQIIKHLAKNNENNDELKYTIGRLVRGLGSAKLTSRIGFYTSLTVLLQRTRKDRYDVNHILDVVAKELHTSGKNPKSENADILAGLILVCGAVLRSGRFSDLETAQRQVLLQHLVTASNKKSYLGLLANSLIVDSLEKLDKKIFAEDIIPVLRPQLKKPLEDYTLDNLYLLLKFQDRFPNVITTKFLANLIDSDGIFTVGNVRPLVNVLTHILPIKNISQHPVYEFFAQKLSASDILPKFLVALDENFERVSQVKHQVQAVLLTHLVENLQDPEQLPLVFGKQFVHETVLHFKTPEGKTKYNEVSIALRELFRATAEATKKEGLSSDGKLRLLKTLMFYPGIFIFEKVTSTKVLQQISATLDADGVKQLTEVYKTVMTAEAVKWRNDQQTELWLNLDRIYAAQLVTKMLNHPAMKGESEWKNEQLQVLMDLALVEHDTVGVELAKAFKETFFRALDAKLPKLQDMRTRLSLLVHCLDDKVTSNGLRTSLEEDVLAMWTKAVGLIDKMEKKSKVTHLTPVFHTLFLHMALQLFDDSKLATDSLNELFSCYENRKLKDSEVNWIEVVVDLFLNLLSHTSRLIRTVISCVFPYLCQHLTPTAVHQILQVLDPKADDNPLSVDSSDDEDEDDDANGEEEEDSNVEEEDDEDSAEEDSDEEFEDTQNDKLRQAIQDVFLSSGNAGQSDVESVDLDDMSDTECDQLNSALGEAFKRFKPNLARRRNKKQTRDEETLTHFRVRVMDLIDIYLDSIQGVSMVICLEIMLPLLQSLEFSIRDAHQKPLHDRIKSVLKKLSSLKHFANCDEVDESVLCTLLQSILDKGSKSAMMAAEMGNMISDCCMFIVKCSTHIPQTKKKSKVAGILVESLETFFTKRDCLTPYVLFKSIMDSSWEHKVNLVQPLLGYVFNEEIRPFRRRQAVEMLRIFYNNKRALVANQEKYLKVLGKSETPFRTATFAFFEGKEYKCKESFLVCLFQLLTEMKNCCLQTGFEWEQLGELVREYRAGLSIGQDAKSAFKKLCTALKVAQIVKMKPTLVKLSMVNHDIANGDNDDDDKVPDEKKKGNKEAKKLKKAARNLRMASLSEGMGKAFTFSSADVDYVNDNAVEQNGDDDMDDDEEVPEAALAPVQNGKASKSKRRKSNSQSEPETIEAESPKKKKKKKKQK